MKKSFSASVWREGPWFVAQCLEVDVASQGETEVSRRSSHVRFVKDTPEGVVTAVVPDYRERRKTARETMRILERAAASPKSW